MQVKLSHQLYKPLVAIVRLVSGWVCLASGDRAVLDQDLIGVVHPFELATPSATPPSCPVIGTPAISNRAAHLAAIVRADPLTKPATACNSGRIAGSDQRHVYRFLYQITPASMPLSPDDEPSSATACDTLPEAAREPRQRRTRTRPRASLSALEPTVAAGRPWFEPGSRLPTNGLQSVP